MKTAAVEWRGRFALPGNTECGLLRLRDRSSLTRPDKPCRSDNDKRRWSIREVGAWLERRPSTLTTRNLAQLDAGKLGQTRAVFLFGVCVLGHGFLLNVG